MKINIPTLKPFLPELLKAREIWLVGGAVRDTIISEQSTVNSKQVKSNKKSNCLPIKDLDFAVKGSAIEFARKFAKRINGSFVLLDKENDEARVVYKIKDTRFKIQHFKEQNPKL